MQVVGKGWSVGFLLLVTACGGGTEHNPDAASGAGGGPGSGGASGSSAGSNSSLGGAGVASGTDLIILGSTDGVDSTSSGGGGPGTSNPRDCWGTSGSPDPSGDGECAAASCLLRPAPLDIYVIVDDTISMGEDCPLDVASPPPAGSSAWCVASHGLASFFTSAKADGDRAALQFMAVEHPVCEGGADNGHATAAVPWSSLPVDASSELIRSLDDRKPADASAATATESALRGITRFTGVNYSAERSLVGVLIAGSNPSACSEDAEVLSGIAREHLESTGIETFVIGLGDASSSLLEALGEAGGTPALAAEFCPDGVEGCHHFNVAANDAATLRDELEAIVEIARKPCQYPLPPPPAGELLNPNTVNVQVDYPEGTRELIPKVFDAKSCQAQRGWHYDDPAVPTAVQLCETSCETATRAGVQLSIAYGCATLLD